MLLDPILVMGLGRSGTTAMMSFLGTDPTVAFDRIAAFENRQLCYLAKFSLLVNRRLTMPEFEEYKLRDIDESVFGPPPWYPGGFFPEPAVIDFFPALWETFSNAVAQSPSIRFYAEKAPTWMAGFAIRYTNPFTIRLFRDPRDNFISALAFMRKRGNMVGFGRDADDSDETFVRTTCYRWINFYEAWRMTRPDMRSMMVRYEDFVAAPRTIAAELKARIDLNVDPAAIHVGDHHISARSVRDSVSRHLSEALPPSLHGLFDEYLSEEMTSLKYVPGAASRFPRFDFKDFPALSSPDGTMTPGEDRAVVDITGVDFCLYPHIGPVDAARVYCLWLSARAPLGDHCSVYWRREGEFFSEERVIHLSYFPGEQWRVFQFNLFAHPLWNGTIVEMRLDLFNFREPLARGSGEAAWFRLVANV